jgi:nucleotide-binding universal stress UspA family protein
MTDPLRAILVPLDGSELAEQALPPALALARASGAALYLTHVFVTYSAPLDMPGAVQTHIDIERQLEQDARAYLQRVADRIAPELPEQVRCEPTRTRPLQSPYAETVAVIDSLRRLARELHADLIVMATHARGGVSRAWLGSVADALVRRGTAPILLVHPRTEPLPASEPFRHILVPLDGSALAEESLPVVQTLASLSDARLTLLQVIVPQRAIARPAPVTRVNAQHLAARESEATRYLAAVRDRLHAAGGPCPETAIVVAEQPARAILDYAADHDADLIAMSTHGLGGVKRFMLGSVADKVVRSAPLPVLLTKPAQLGRIAESGEASTTG